MPITATQAPPRTKRPMPRAPDSASATSDQHESEVVEEEPALSNVEADRCERIAEQLLGDLARLQQHHHSAQSAQQACGDGR